MPCSVRCTKLYLCLRQENKTGTQGVTSRKQDTSSIAVLPTEGE